jgi:hypothetical protein
LRLYVDVVQIGAIAIIDKAEPYHPSWKLRPGDRKVIENCVVRLLRTREVRTHRFA